MWKINGEEEKNQFALNYHLMLCESNSSQLETNGQVGRLMGKQMKFRVFCMNEYEKSHNKSRSNFGMFARPSSTLFRDWKLEQIVI